MHSHYAHREHKKSKERVSKIMKSGGVAQHSDMAADKKLFADLINKHERGEVKAEGRKAPSRFARGGKVKRGDTNIAIVVPQKGGGNPPVETPPMGPQAGAAPGPTAAPAPPPGMPPGPPPGGPPMPMRARGGKVLEAAGDASAGNLEKWSKHAEKGSYARGGRLPDAGAATGVGRLEKAATQKRK
jgi:hypothetical protein